MGRKKLPFVVKIMSETVVISYDDDGGATVLTVLEMKKFARHCLQPPCYFDNIFTLL